MNKIRTIIRFCNDGGFWIICMIVLALAHGISYITMGQSEWDHLTSYTVCEPTVYGTNSGWLCPYVEDDEPHEYTASASSINNRWLETDIIPLIINEQENPKEVFSKPKDGTIVVIRGTFVGEWTGLTNTVFMMVPDHILPRLDKLVEANTGENN